MNVDIGALSTNWISFARGLSMTLLLCVVSLPAGFAAGTALAFLRAYGPRPVRWAVTAYVEAVRNVPFLIQIFLLFFALPFIGLRLEAGAAGVIALSSYAAAYFSEIVRGGLAAVPAGQTEAARALGLSASALFRRVLLPQAHGYILPAAGNLAITVVKESSVLSVIAVRELTYVSQDVIGRTFASLEVLTLMALLYWGVTTVFSSATRSLEEQLQRGRSIVHSTLHDSAPSTTRPSEN